MIHVKKKVIGVTDDLNEKIDVMLRSSWKISFVTFLCDLSGKDWNPRQDRSMKGFCNQKKKTFSSTATKFEAGVIFIWLVFCIIFLDCCHAHLLECGIHEI